MRVRLGLWRRGRRPRTAVPARSPSAFDLLDVPAGPGHRVLLQMERLGAPLGPVLEVPGGAAGSRRLYFFVDAGSTGSVPSDLVELGWDPGEVDVRSADAPSAAGLVVPLPGGARWMRTPECERTPKLPPAHLLLGTLAYACRRPGSMVSVGARRAV